MADGFRNAYIFVSDALRWDYLPENFADFGPTLKTVAASTMTPSSFSSICSGQNPPSHGVKTFGHQLTDNPLRNLPGYEVSLWQEPWPGETEPLFDVLRFTSSTEKRPLTELSEPFVNIERGLHTHAPYGSNKSQSSRKFLAEVRSADDRTLAGTYEEGVQTAIDHFKDRLSYLDAEGLLEDTLVVFTSDHGELLGEYGETSHTVPLVPELAYVPTVICSDVDDMTSDRLFRHVDVVPTLADLLDLDIAVETAGRSIRATDTPAWGYCEYHKPPGFTTLGQTEDSTHEYYVQSVWTRSGGWVHNRSTWLDSLRELGLAGIADVALSSPMSVANTVDQYVRRWRKFSTPGITRDEAKSFIESVACGAEAQATAGDLSEDQEEQLRDLGYL